MFFFIGSTVSYSATSTQAVEVFDWTIAKVIQNYNKATACVMFKGLEQRAAFMFHYKLEHDSIEISLHKETWDIPPGARTSIYMYFGNETPWSLEVSPAGPTGLIYRLSSNGKDYVDAGLFIHELRTTHKLRIQFGGSEPDWEMSLMNSDTAFMEFQRCAREIKGQHTQPFNSIPPKLPENTQPFNDMEHRIPLSPVLPRPGEPRKF